MGALLSCLRDSSHSPTPTPTPPQQEVPLQNVRPHAGERPGATPATGPGSFQSHMESQTLSGQGRLESPAAPASPAHSSGQAPGVPSVGPSTPQRTPIDAVHFRDSPSGAQRIVNAQNQTTQYIRDLDARSPSFHNTLGTATNNGRNSLDLTYDRINTGQQGLYNPTKHSIMVDPFHPQNADAGHMQGVAAFEVHNAANRQDLQEVTSQKDNGGYEQAANRRNEENPGAPPVTGARLYAQDQEHLEWVNAKQTHQAMTEGAQQGLQAPPVFSNKFEAPAGGQAPWAEFQGYQKEQWQSGHTQQYMSNYQDRRTELGQGGPSASPPSPSPSFGEPGPEV